MSRLVSLPGQGPYTICSVAHSTYALLENDNDPVPVPTRLHHAGDDKEVVRDHSLIVSACGDFRPTEPMLVEYQAKRRRPIVHDPELRVYAAPCVLGKRNPEPLTSSKHALQLTAGT